MERTRRPVSTWLNPGKETQAAIARIGKPGDAYELFENCRNLKRTNSNK
jgi:hypothetical protein